MKAKRRHDDGCACGRCHYAPIRADAAREALLSLARWAGRVALVDRVQVQAECRRRAEAAAKLEQRIGEIEGLLDSALARELDLFDMR